MIPDADIVRAKLRVDVIARDVALRRAGRVMVGCCPFHAEKTPSFYVYEDGHFHCYGCGAHGSPIDYLIRVRGVDFVEAVRELLNLPPQRAKDAPAKAAAAAPAQDRTEDIRKILTGCTPIARQTAAHLYLWSRGLPTHQPALLAHPALYCHEVRKALPALVAPLTDADGQMVALQRIWVVSGFEAGAAKDARAPLKVRKKTLGTMGAAAVRLRPAGAVLGLAEGVETAIAAAALFCMPVWAVCGAARLGLVDIPPEVEKVLIFGDRGDTGEELAERARLSYFRQRIPCEVVLPDAPASDFNDQLIGVAA